jgi:hypothetical protein
MKRSLLVLGIVAMVGFLADAAFKKRFHTYLASRGIVMSA